MTELFFEDRMCRVGGAVYHRILIVEDELPLRRAIVRNLASRGHEVREATTAAEAIASLTENEPDLLLLDINLPDRTGWDVLREMRQREMEVPTIIVSAVRASQSRLSEFHPLAYLPKPFPLEALLRLVEQEEVAEERDMEESDDSQDE